MQSTQSKPITSQKLLDDFSLELRKIQESYYLIFHIILETGMPLIRLLDCKVSDLYRKPRLEYDSRHHSAVYKVPISLRLQRDLAEYLDGRNAKDFAFLGARSNKPLCPTAFQKGLYFTSQKLNVTPVVTPTILRKTFVYRTIINDGNYVRAAHFIDASGPKEVNRYLGIDLPGKITFEQASRDLDKALSRGALKKMKKTVLHAFDELEHLSEHKEERTLDNTLKALSELDALREFSERFSM